MAKQQGLTPNPAKLTGMCGKLKCCLAYEHACYQELRKGLPKVGTHVDSPKGMGKITDLNILKRECAVQLFGGAMVRCPCDKLRLLEKEEKEKALQAARKAAEDAEEGSKRTREKRRKGRRDAKKS